MMGDNGNNNAIEVLAWPHRPPGPQTPNEASPEERQQARAIKKAIEESEEDIRPLPDFDYVHLAITCEGNIQEAVDVAYKLQCFREMYNIQDTIDDAMQTIRGFMSAHPGVVLDVSLLPDEQTFWFFVDHSKVRGSEISTEQDMRGIQGGYYYVLRSMASNIPAIRNGIITMLECEGADFHSFNMKLEERCFQEFRQYYPTKYKETFFVHTSMATVMFLGMIKRFMNNRQLKTLYTVRRIADQDFRLDELFLVPTPEIAAQHVLTRLEGYLRERYRLESEFTLDEEEEISMEEPMDDA